MSNEVKMTEKDLLKGGLLIGAADLLDSEEEIISISPNMDLGLNGGIPEGSFVNLSGKEKSGKAQTLDSIIYTKKGPTELRNIKVGDVICSPFNKSGLTKVVGVYPQGYKDVYKITFLDGDSVKCCEDHLWSVIKITDSSEHLMTCKELISQYKTKKDRKKWYIKLPLPLSFSYKYLDIDPYVMGALIGDGGFTGGSLRFCNSDKELITNIQNRLIYGYEIKLIPNTDIEYRISRGRTGGKTNFYINALRKYGLWNLKSGKKFIPKDYLYANIEQRFLLLAGLMDTDGTISKRGHCSYSTTSYQLALDVKELVQSLGGLAKIGNKTTYINYNNKIKKCSSYRVHIKFTNKENCFLLSRKKKRIIPRTKSELKRTIAKIELLNKQEECACIKVAEQDGLYITDNFIVTHNTTLALHIASKAQTKEYGCRPTFLIDVEHRIKKMHLRGIKGLKLATKPGDTSGLQIVRSIEGKILSAQEILTGVIDLIKNYPKAVIILDSTSALCSSQELTSSITGTGRALGPRMLAEFCRQAGPIVPIQKTILISIQHLIANTSGYGSPYMEDSGKKLQYQSDVKLRCKSSAPIEVQGKEVGRLTEWSVLWSALGAPGAKVKTYIRYGIGVDELAELIDLALDFGLIAKAGSWMDCIYLHHNLDAYTLKFVAESGKEPEKAFKVQGSEGLYQFMENNPTFVDILKNEVKEML